MTSPRTELAPIPPSSSAQRGLLGLALLLAIALAYAPVFGAGFVYDDHLLVLRNPAIAQLDLGTLLARPMWAFHDAEHQLAVGYWRPATSVLLGLTYWFAGPNPLAFHLLVLVLHAGACCAAWALARRIARSDAVGFAVALLFALHPVHVESVAWISAVGDPAFGLCVLLALERHLAWREAGSRGSPWIAGALVLLGLAAKEVAAGALIAVVVLDLAFDHRPRGWRAYAPYALAIALYVLARMAVFHSVLAGFDRTTTEFGVGAGRLLLLRAEILGLALRYGAWPSDLRLFHPFVPDATRAGLALPLALLAAWAVLVVWLTRRVRDGGWSTRALLAAAALALAPLAVLVLRVDVLGTFPFAERQLYVAVFGIVLLAALLASRLPRAVAILALVVAAGAAGAATRTQAATWRDDGTLFRTAAERSPRVPHARWVYGRELVQRYRLTRDPETLFAAEREFTVALDLLLAAQRGDGSILGLVDDHVQANVGLGWVHLYRPEVEGTRDFDPAAQIFRMATASYPDSQEAWTGLGVALLESGDLPGARAALDKALVLDERFVEAHRNLGRLHMRSGDWSAARASFEAALRWQPDSADTLLLLGSALERSGDDVGARRMFDRAAGIAPDDARPRVQRAILDAKAGHFDDAQRELEAALVLDPRSAEAHLTRGKVQAARGEEHGALMSFQRACELDTTSFEAHNNAGILALKLESVPQAMPFLLRAYENRPDEEAGRRLGDAIRNLPVASPEAFVQLATSDADRGDVEGTLAWLALALELQPENGPANFLKGSMLVRKRDFAGAREALEKAENVLHDSFPVQDALAGVLIELGDEKGALEHYRKALELLERVDAGSGSFEQPMKILRGKIERLRQGG